MKFGKFVRGVVVAYIVVGVAVVLVQLVASWLFEPSCAGTARHTLTDGSRVSQVVTWLPSLFTQTVRGEMTVRNYLLGGFHCEEVTQPGRAISQEYLRALIEGVPPTQESLSARMEKASKPLNDAREPTRTKVGTDDGPAIIAIQDVSFELPGNWVEIDKEKVLANKAPGVTVLEGRQFQSPELPATAVVRVTFTGSLAGDLESAESFSRKIIVDMQALGLTNVVVT